MRYGRSGSASAAAFLALVAAPASAQVAGAEAPPVASGPTESVTPVSQVEGTPAASAVVADAPAGGPSADEPGPMPSMPREAEPGDGLTLALGLTVWEGDLGAATDTRIGVVLGNARYRFGDVRLDATLPWMTIRSAAAVFTGIDGSPLIAARDAGLGRRTREGLGDVTLGARWLALSEDRAGADIELSGRVKLPTASDRSGLSTGETDFAVGAEASRRFGPLVPSARVTYRVFGDPAAIDLIDGFTASVGTAFILTDRTILVASYDYAERASRLIGDAHEATLGASTPLVGRLRINSFGSVGLSRSAPDYSLGVSISLGFGG